MTVFKAMTVLILGAVFIGCAPDYPDDEHHQGVTNDDCISCHIDREVEGVDARVVPANHKEGGDVDSRHDNCKGCHDRAR